MTTRLALVIPAAIAVLTLAERRGFRIFIDMGIERPDGDFHNIPKPVAQPYAKIVR